MAIASLSTLSTSHFKGGKNLTGAGSHALVGELNTAINKINEVITGMIDLDTLEVGTAGAGVYYGGTNDSWMSIDGSHPPRVSRMQWIDHTTGNWVTAYVDGGVWVLA